MPAPASGGDIRWVDGLRGVASLLVVNAHISRSIFPVLLSPGVKDASSLFWQLPIIRNAFMGRASIAIFAIVSGYVNSLKAIKLFRENQAGVALPMIAKTTFRRTGRFVFPTMVITILTWLVCQLGLFKLGRSVAWAWIRDTSPAQSVGVLAALGDLYLSLGKTWVDGGNAYDPVQWTLCYLLHGSMLVYLTLFATAYVQSRYRYVVYLVMYAYYYWMSDALVGINTYLGLILAEITHEPAIAAHVIKPGMGLVTAAYAAILAGFYVASYPEEQPELAGWSVGLNNMGRMLFPGSAEQGRFWPAIGSQLVVVGLFFAPRFKKLLSWAPLVWMGKVSFPIYLIHAPLMRSLLVYMVFGLSDKPTPQPDPSTGEVRLTSWVPQYNSWLTGLSIMVFYLVLYRAAGAWVRWVDPACGILAKRLEEWMFVESETMEKNAPLALSA